MGFQDISGPDCCCGGGGVCTAVLSSTTVCGVVVPTTWVVKTNPGGVTIATGSNGATITIPASGGYEVTTNFSASGFAACSNTVLDTPKVEDFSITCPGTIGVPLTTSILTFSRTFNFVPTFAGSTTCPTITFCSTIFDDLTITSTSYGPPGNVGKHASFFGGAASIQIDGLQPSVPMTINFICHVVYANIPGFPPCPSVGAICLTFTGSATVTVDPCAAPACTYPININVPMS